jgi:dephospho-CoA kinase
VREAPTRPRRIALTGGIATGKSHVRARFEALGVPTIDSDVLARQAVEPGTPGIAAVVREFGADMLDAAGALDRKKLAAVVFADPARRRVLEAIIHPAVRAATDAWFGALDPAIPFAIADIPLLYETGRDQDFDAVVVTAAEPQEQLRRVMARDGLDETAARQRIASQLPIAVKVARADYVIRTDGTFEDTERQVKEVIERLLEENDNDGKR